MNGIDLSKTGEWLCLGPKLIEKDDKFCIGGVVYTVRWVRESASSIVRFTEYWIAFWDENHRNQGIMRVDANMLFEIERNLKA